jgi:hypothetical protein
MSRTFFPLATLLCVACGGTSVPRVADPVPVQALLDVGAMADASRAFPVAFYANPGEAPEIRDLASGAIQGSQWLTELARNMNVALAKAGLFDERFTPLSQQVFNYEVESGDVIYKWREPAGGPQFLGVRVAKLSLKEFKAAAGLGEAVTAQATVEVTIPSSGFAKFYACEKTSAKWDREVFTCIGERILGDPGFWKGVEAAP